MTYPRDTVMVVGEPMPREALGKDTVEGHLKNTDQVSGQGAGRLLEKAQMQVEFIEIPPSGASELLRNQALYRRTPQ